MDIFGIGNKHAAGESSPWFLAGKGLVSGNTAKRPEATPPRSMSRQPPILVPVPGYRRLRRLVCSLFVAWSFAAPAQELIVNKDTGVERLTRNEARLYLTMRLKSWPNGTLVKLFVLPDDNALHLHFVNSVLGLYPYQLRRAWDRQLYSGTGQAPVTVSSVNEMLERVAMTPGALGYIDVGTKAQDIRVVEVQ